MKTDFNNHANAAAEFEIPLVFTVSLEEALDEIPYLMPELKEIRSLTTAVDLNRYTSTSIKILHFLNHPDVGKSKWEHYDSRVPIDMLDIINRAVKKEQPISLVIQAFSFKQYTNPLKTRNVLPDLGEAALLHRFYDLDRLIRAVYPPGLQWNVILESRALASIFDIPETVIQKYVDGLLELDVAVRQRFSSQFNSTSLSPIRFHDLRKLLGGQNSRSGVGASGLVCKVMPSEDIIRFHMGNVSDLTKYLVDYSLGDLKAVCYGCEELDAKQQVLYDNLYLKGLALARRYMALMESRGDVVARTFPGSLYISITYKPQRFTIYPIHRDNRRLPSHGVPIISTRKERSVRVTPLIELLENRSRYIAFRLEGQDQPFYYAKKKVLAQQSGKNYNTDNTLTVE